MAWRPRSTTPKKRRAESGDQVKLSMERSTASVGVVTFPVARSSTISRQRSLSYPARCCERYAIYLPSGEYCGELSAPGLLVIFRDSPPVMGTTYRSLLVLAAGTGSAFMA